MAAWRDTTLDVYANNGVELGRAWRGTTVDIYANNGLKLTPWRDTSLDAYVFNVTLHLVSADWRGGGDLELAPWTPHYPTVRWEDTGTLTADPYTLPTPIRVEWTGQADYSFTPEDDAYITANWTGQADYTLTPIVYAYIDVEWTGQADYSFRPNDLYLEANWTADPSPLTFGVNSTGYIEADWTGQAASSLHPSVTVRVDDTPADFVLDGMGGTVWIQRDVTVQDVPADFVLTGLHAQAFVAGDVVVHDIPADFVLTGLHATAGVETRPLGSQPPMSGPGWVAKAVDMHGNVYATLERVNVKRWVRELNQPDEVGVELPKHDPLTSQVQTLKREVQLWFDGDLKAWVVPVSKRGASSDAAIARDALDPSWYLHKRFLGGPELPNRIGNGSFEEGLARWTAFSTSATVVTSPTLLGGQAVRLVSSGDGGMLAQAIGWDGGQNSNLMYASGWFYLESLPGERVDTPGLTIRAWTASGGTWEGTSRITDRTELHTWTRVEVRCKVPAGLSTVQVEAHGPHGSIVWDDIRVFLSDALAPDGGPANPATWGTDIAGMAFRTVKLAQAAAHGKSDVNIGVDAQPTGTVTRRGWPLRTHPQVTAVLKELRETGGGMEHRMRFTPTTRTFVARKLLGTDRSGTLTLRNGSVESGGNLASWTVNEDATAVVTSAVAQGNYPGWTKQEQSWSDASKLGGLVLDAVVQADDGVLPDKLAGVAKEYVEENNTPRVDMTVTTHDGDAGLFHTLGIGDRVNVDVDDGDIQIHGRHRIIKITAEPKTLSLTLDLVRY